jgi:23S rRNA (cytosine1962-C5)-methyltransferase
VKTHFDVDPEVGEFFLRSTQKRDLPMGTFLRFRT